jgi:hypothetical protein
MTNHGLAALLFKTVLTTSKPRPQMTDAGASFTSPALRASPHRKRKATRREIFTTRFNREKETINPHPSEGWGFFVLKNNFQKSEIIS